MNARSGDDLQAAGCKLGIYKETCYQTMRANPYIVPHSEAKAMPSQKEKESQTRTPVQCAVALDSMIKAMLNRPTSQTLALRKIIAQSNLSSESDKDIEVEKMISRLKRLRDDSSGSAFIDKKQKISMCNSKDSKQEMDDVDAAGAQDMAARHTGRRYEDVRSKRHRCNRRDGQHDDNETKKRLKLEADSLKQMLQNHRRDPFKMKLVIQKIRIPRVNCIIVADFTILSTSHCHRHSLLYDQDLRGLVIGGSDSSFQDGTFDNLMEELPGILSHNNGSLKVAYVPADDFKEEHNYLEHAKYQRLNLSKICTCAPTVNSFSKVYHSMRSENMFRKKGLSLTKEGQKWFAWALNIWALENEVHLVLCVGWNAGSYCKKDLVTRKIKDEYSRQRLVVDKIREQCNFSKT